MSLKKTDNIDLVVLLPKESSQIALIIYDIGDITDVEIRFNELQNKLKAYWHFIVSGQFAKTYPQFAELEPCIKVICRNQPTNNMRAINQIGDSAHSETFISVEVLTDVEFRKKFNLRTNQ